MSPDGIDYSVEYMGLNKPVNLLSPVLSVRIITYNHERYISECIESALMQQTDFPFEIVIGEDDSTDGTREICKAYAQKYPNRIRVILRGKENRILIDGVKTGRFNFIETIRSCRGEFVAMLDGDDFWTDPLKLQKQVDFLSRNPTFALAVHDARLADAGGRTLGRNVLRTDQQADISQLELKKGFSIVTSTMCFRNVIKEFPMEFYQVINGDSFLTSMLGKYGPGRFISEIGPATYRLHGDSMFSSLSATKALEFLISTRFHMANYYTRMNELELASYFRQEELRLTNIRNKKMNLYFYLLKKKVYLFQLFFLRNRLKTILDYFRK